MLTTAKLSVYYQLTASHQAVGIGLLNMRAALSRSVSFAAFCCRVMPFMGGLGGEPKGSLVPSQVVQPVMLHPPRLDSWQVVVNQPMRDIP